MQITVNSDEDDDDDDNDDVTLCSVDLASRYNIYK
jgi:hypothetical protein